MAEAMKVKELAITLGISYFKLLGELKTLGIKAQHQLSPLTSEEVARVLDVLQPKAPEPPPPSSPPVEPEVVEPVPEPTPAEIPPPAEPLQEAPPEPSAELPAPEPPPKEAAPAAPTPQVGDLIPRRPSPKSLGPVRHTAPTEAGTKAGLSPGQAPTAEKPAEPAPASAGQETATGKIRRTAFGRQLPSGPGSAMSPVKLPYGIGPGRPAGAARPAGTPAAPAKAGAPKEDAARDDKNAAKKPKPDDKARKLAASLLEEEKPRLAKKLKAERGGKVRIQELEIDEEAGEIVAVRETVGRSKIRRKIRHIKEEEEAKRAAAASGTPQLDEPVTVRDLAEYLEVSHGEILGEFMKLGLMLTINQVVDKDTCYKIGEKFGKVVEFVSLEEIPEVGVIEEKVDGTVPRAPVVTVMGHVDHGKTTLLDAIRETNVVDKESGGITQHIGAYKVRKNNQDIVFLDTPGHQAFTSMRARGAQVTDIVVLVVAADDGVQPQTREAIDHARSANVPIIVAVNKVDKEGANSMRVRTDLAQLGLLSEDLGGQTIFVEVSAKKRTNIEGILEMILLQAEVLELKANPGVPARGTVIEARLDKRRGPLMTLLVQTGTLREGDPFVVGSHYGKVRAMFSDTGERLVEAGPSSPVEILGLDGVPAAGDIFVSVDSERKARLIAEQRQAKQRDQAVVTQSRMSLEDLYKQISEGEVKELPIIVKADVQGSAEALTEELKRNSTAAVQLKVIHTSVGNITETDVALAAASNAIILGFHVGVEGKARTLATSDGVDIRLYEIIYEATDDIRKAMEGLLEPIIEEEIIGKVEVRQVFQISRYGKIAGVYVTEGKVLRSALARLYRKEELLYEGKINTLKRFKEDVKEVQTGYECGICLENYQSILEGDAIVFYTQKKVAAKL